MDLEECSYEELELEKWKILNKQLRETAKQKKMPIAATFELTPLCNFNCNMCYVHLDIEEQKKQGKLLTTQQWIEIGEKAAKAGVLHLTLTGGELFTRSDYRELIESLSNMGFLITIYSNGFLIDNDLAIWLQQFKLVQLRVTLYGASDDTYKKICGVNNGFTILKRNLLNLREKGVSFSTVMTVVKDNEKDIEYLTQWTKENDISFAYTTGVMNSSRENIKGNPVKNRIVEEIIDESIINEYEIEHTCDLCQGDYDHPFSICKIFGCGFQIRWDGKMILCGMLNSIYEDVIDEDLLTCFKRLCSRLELLKKPEKCKSCKYINFCRSCPGTLEGETGSPCETNDFVCNSAMYSYFNKNILSKRKKNEK